MRLGLIMLVLTLKKNNNDDIQIQIAIFKVDAYIIYIILFFKTKSFYLEE